MLKIYKVEIKDSVRETINEISEYIYRFSFSRESSRKVYDEIYKKIFSLKIFPKKYSKFNEKYRVITIDKKYRVFFKVDEEKEIVFVSAIFYSKEDYSYKF